MSCDTHTRAPVRGPFRHGIFTIIWLLTLAASSGSFRADEAVVSPGERPAVTGPGIEPQPLSADQAEAARLAGAAGLEIGWDSQWGTPLSVRGRDLAQRRAFSGGRGILPAGAGEYRRNAIAVLDNLARLFRIRDAEEEFAPSKLQSDGLGFRHVRIAQRYRGLRVFGGDLIVHFDGEGRAYQVNGRYVPDIRVGVEPRLTPDDALRVARKDLAALRRPTAQLSEGPELVVFALNAMPQLAYQLMLSYEQSPDGPGRWRYWVDARQGRILLRYDNIQRIPAPTANGTNEVMTGTILAGEGGGTTNVTGWRENTGSCYLYSKPRRWYVWNNGGTGGGTNWSTVIDGNTYAYRTTNDWVGSDRAEMSAANNFEWIQKYFHDVHNWDSFDGANSYARANVHEGFNYVNAFWDGSDFHFGDGNGSTAGPLAVLDVCAHEFTHGVDEHTADLIYSGESGALNESFSDIFGACVEFYAEPDGRALYPAESPGTADWLCGEDCWLSTTALRDLRCPTNHLTVGLSGRQPSRYKGTYWDPYGEVHQNDGVQNFFFYLLSDGGSGNNDGILYNVTGIGVTNAEKVAFRALSVYCVPSTDYNAARGCWISAAADLNTNWMASVAAAWSAVGIGAMGIKPDGGLGFSGPFSGPFSPTSQICTLSNRGTVPMNWSISHSQNWLDVAPASGSIAANGSNLVSVSLNTNANRLGIGVYADSLAVSNSVDAAIQTCPVSLSVEKVLLVTPFNTVVFRGPVGGPFSPAAFAYAVTNRTAQPINWGVVSSQNWATVSPAGGSIPGFGAASAAVSLNANAAGLPAGVATNVLVFTNSLDGATHSRTVLVGVGLPDPFTELFDAADNDLDNQSWTFTPDGSTSFYAVARTPATEFPTDPAGGTPIAMTDDSYTNLPLTNGVSVSLYGVARTNLFIGSNGYITLGTGSTSYVESLSSHFSLPRVAALYDDLNPATGGTISWKRLQDRVAVTYQNLPQYAAADTNSVQIEMFFDGRLRITCLRMDATDGLIGLSRGQGTPALFLESDFSAYGAGKPSLSLSLPASVTEGDGVLEDRGVARIPVPLSSNLIVTLSSSDETELTVPPDVTIPAGQTNAAFDLTVVDDLILDWTQMVAVVATAGGYETGQVTVAVLDNDQGPYHVSPAGSNIYPYLSWATAATDIPAALALGYDGALVLVTNGEYEVTNEILIASGTTLRSVNGAAATVVRRAGPAAHRVFRLTHASAVVDGFTISNGWAAGSYGGAVWLDGAGTLQNCVLRDNVAASGGGLWCKSGGTARNCLIVGNRANIAGGVLCQLGGTVENCTVAGNWATNYFAGGIRCFNGGTVRNTIIWSNAAAEAANYTNSGTGWSYSHCDTGPAVAGTNNLAADPRFADGGAENYRLESSSLCVNSGTNQLWMSDATDIEGAPRTVESVVDMGAYELMPADLDSDGDGMPDEWEWRYSHSTTNMSAGADADGDGMSNLDEYAAGTVPTDPDSVLRFGPTEPTAGSDFVIRWFSESNRHYQLLKSTNLLEGFDNVKSNIFATPPVNAYTDTVDGLERSFYRIRLEP